MKKIILFLILIVVMLSGCSSKNVESVSQTSNSTSEEEMISSESLKTEDIEEELTPELEATPKLTELEELTQNILNCNNLVYQSEIWSVDFETKTKTIEIDKEELLKVLQPELWEKIENNYNSGWLFYRFSNESDTEHIFVYEDYDYEEDKYYAYARIGELYSIPYELFEEIRDFYLTKTSEMQDSYEAIAKDVLSEVLPEMNIVATNYINTSMSKEAQNELLNLLINSNIRLTNTPEFGIGGPYYELTGSASENSISFMIINSIWLNVDDTSYFLTMDRKTYDEALNIVREEINNSIKNGNTSLSDVISEFHYISSSEDEISFDTAITISKEELLSVLDLTTFEIVDRFPNSEKRIAHKAFFTNIYNDIEFLEIMKIEDDYYIEITDYSDIGRSGNYVKISKETYDNIINFISEKGGALIEMPTY